MTPADLVLEKLKTREDNTIVAICRAFSTDEHPGAIDKDVAVQLCIKLATLRELATSLKNGERTRVTGATKVAERLDSP